MGACCCSNTLTEGVEVIAKVWALPSEEQPYPEMQEIPSLANTMNIGIALQGGGLRSACMGLGTLAAVDSMGVLQNVRYMVGVSGSAFVVGPLGYLPPAFSVDEFFSNIPTDPSQLSPTVLSEAPEGSVVAAISGYSPATAAGCQAIACRDVVYCPCTTCGCSAAACGLPTHVAPYIRAVVEPLLQPWNLAVEGSVLSAPAGSHAHQRALAAVQTAGAAITPMRPGVPFPILAASRLIKGAGKSSLWCPFEFTPLYSGTPVDRSNAPGGPVGGGVIESFALDGRAPGSLPDGKTSISKVAAVKTTPTTFVPLADAVGCSSEDIYTHQLPCMSCGACGVKSIGGTAINLWSPLDIHSGNNRMTAVADGGPTDAVGLLALLRRRVGKALVQCADGSSITSVPDIRASSWWPAYFGCVENGALPTYAEDAAHMNAYQQVFATSEFDSLYNELMAKARAGQPITAERVLEVQENKMAGVSGGWKVHLLWCIPSVPTAFMNALPTGTQDQMRQAPTKGKVGLSTDIPFTGSFDTYTAEAVRMEAELTAYTLMNGFTPETLRKFFGAPPVGARARSSLLTANAGRSPFFCGAD